MEATPNFNTDYNRVAALAIELRDKLSEVELQLKLLKPIAAEILRTVDHRPVTADDVGNVMPKDPSGGSYPNPSSAAPIDPQMLVGLRWDFEEYSSAPISIANSAYSPSTELSESPERTTASYLWKRMMKKSPKKLTPQLSVPISTAPPPVNDESSLVMRRSSSIEVGSIIAEVGSREALDSRAEIPTIREPQSQSNASSNASNNITSAASGLYEKERSSSVLHHQLPSLFKSDSIHSSYSPSKANKRTSVRMESNLGKADTQSTTVSTVATPTHATSPLSQAVASPAFSSAPMLSNPPDSPSPSVNRRKTKESRRSVVSKGDGSPQMERKITKASGGSVVSRTELPVACSFWKVGLSPNSTFFAVWEFIISLYYLLIIWIIPIMIAFDENQFQDQFSMLTTALFGVDAIIQMLTVRSDRVGNYTLKQWVLRYFANELLLDIVTVVPFDLIAFRGAEYFLFLRYLRTVKLSAILKKSPYYIKLRFFLEKKMGIGETYFGFLVLFTVIIISLHVQACAYWHAGRVAKFSSAPIKSVQNKTSTDQYAWGFFQGVGNTFPLIYQPENVVERWIVIVFAFINAVLYAVVVGSFSSYVVGLNASGRLYRQKIDELNEYMEWKKLPRETREKVMRYYEIKYRGKFFEEGTLLGEMNDSLRTEIAVHNCRELIEKVPFLRRQANDGRDEQFIGRIARSLSVGYYVNGDYIIRQGEIGTEMYFIVTGVVHIIVNGNRVATFTDGAFFGEVALIANIPRTASVVAAAPSIIYKLTRNEFMDILLEFDDMRVRIDRIYQERMAKVRAERALVEAQRVETRSFVIERAQSNVEKPLLEKIDTESMGSCDS